MTQLVASVGKYFGVQSDVQMTTAMQQVADVIRRQANAKSTNQMPIGLILSAPNQQVATILRDAHTSPTTVRRFLTELHDMRALTLEALGNSDINSSYLNEPAEQFALTLDFMGMSDTAEQMRYLIAGHEQAHFFAGAPLSPDQQATVQNVLEWVGEFAGSAAFTSNVNQLLGARNTVRYPDIRDVLDAFAFDPNELDVMPPGLALEVQEPVFFEFS